MRRFELDWLRVIVFGLLILYHVGMFFVPWGWHIKNDIIYPGLRWPMVFVNQWRLPILFVISGMGTYFALSGRTSRQFLGERIRRLLLPLAFGMLVIIPPQVYIERLVNGEFSGNYFEFWPSQAFIGSYPEGNLSWHHLWFLPYLLLFSMILIPVFISLRKHPDNRILNWVGKICQKPFTLYWMIIPLYLWESFLEPFFPSTHALVGDWFNLVNFITFFIYGFLLIAGRDTFSHTVRKYRRIYLLLGTISFIMLAGIWINLEDSIIVHFVEAFLKVFNLWSWILAIFGYAITYLNKPGKLLSYANEAVYPFYILHQTITIILGYFLLQTDLGFAVRFLLMTAGTFVFSWLIYELIIRRISWIRPLFGLKPRKSI